MKKYFLLIALTIAMLGSVAFAGNGDKNSNELLRKSALVDPAAPLGGNTTYPAPFTETSNPYASQPAISTGYYYVDSDDDAPDFWKASSTVLDTLEETAYWKRIYQGPRMVPASYWPSNPDEGLRFFRNPYYPTGGRNFFSDGDINATDSTDNAFAGPMPLNFKFYFNGISYDSFYVSTNGLIALTNRRYLYNGGVRSIPPGNTDCYDPMSMDWFIRGGRSGNGISDGNADNFGYVYTINGNQEFSNPTGGIRSPANGNGLQALPNGAAVIAPFWADGLLSQYYPTTRQINDFGKVYYRRFSTNNKILIYFVNYMIKGTLSTPYGSYNAPVDARLGESNYTSAKAQVILDGKDSSVIIIYEAFEGAAVVGGRGVPARIVYRYNTTAGVRGFARHTNYGEVGGPVTPWYAEYQQYTHYYTYWQTTAAGIPHEYLAVRFKQWKNPVRVVDIQYRVRQQDPNADMQFSVIVPTTSVPDYELLAGESRIGAIQPVALLQNLTNQIQGPNGVNFTPQNLKFRARFRIVNLANQRIVYNRLVSIDSLCLATCYDSLQNCSGDPAIKVRYSTVVKASGNYTATNYAPRVQSGETAINPWMANGRPINGVPPYGFVQVYFPPFEPNEFVENQIGRLRSYIIADPTNPTTGDGLGSQWPFDDTTSVRLFVMKRLNDFNDDVTEFHYVEGVAMPSVLKWVNIDADVLSGDEVSKHPLAPRGEYIAKNFDTLTKANYYVVRSPVIHMNRVDLYSNEPAGSPGGDQIRSFPINLLNPVPRYNSVLSISFQRAAKADQWPRGWCDQSLIAPEPRTMMNTNPLTRWNPAQAASGTGDEIDVEYAQPSPDGVQYICNIPTARWRNHPGRGGRAAYTNVPDYALWGSNGYFRGYLETDKDSSLAAPTTTVKNGYRPNNYDEGIDYTYVKGFIPVPDTVIKSSKQGAKNFRFRVNVQAKKDLKCSTCIPDDFDDFYVDNVKLLYPAEVTDLEVTSVDILWPYTMAPASQATQIPVTVRISNNTALTGATFMVHVRIFKGKADEIMSQWNQFKDSLGNPNRPQAVYCRTETPSTLQPNLETIVHMPSWNARASGPGTYTMLSYLEIPGMDLEAKNDTTYSEVTLNFGNYFAYDPVSNPQNDVPTFTSPFNDGQIIYGRGLNLSGYQIGGMGSNVPFASPPWIKDYEFGTTGGDGSGQFAMKFQLLAADTIYGYQALYGKKNQAPDDVSVGTYQDQGNVQPGQLIPNSQLYRQRGVDDSKGGQNGIFDAYVTYLMPSKQPLILNAGTYWIALAQLGETGIELGASQNNMGMRTTNYYYDPNTYVLGQSGYSMMIEKNFRRINPSDPTSSLNNNLFCFENTKGSGTWYQFMPSSGNPAYAHLNHAGTTYVDGYTLTASRGTWIPMIHPYLGPRSYGKIEDAYQTCDFIEAVKVTSFDGVVRNSGIDLFWETAQEENCKGFYVERRLSGEEKWNTLSFVAGHGNSAVANNYNYTDTKVQYGTTYQYRLVEVAADGTQSCPLKDELTKTMDQVANLLVELQSANPVSDNSITVVNVVLPLDQFVNVDVIDLFGNVIKSIDANVQTKGAHQFEWDGKDQNGNKVSSGTYIFKVKTDDATAAIKLSIIR
ncbi:MAG: hypothetical protein NT007_13560 [Candidatus Kapabacteria bacterium]|nr:hypothetical protein [Candidatus Kapabacteria bacterium]